MKIKKNVGGFDRFFRSGTSLAMMYFGFVDKVVVTDQFSGYLLGGFGLIVFLSAVIGMCPLYTIIGFNSREDKSENS